MQLGQTWGSRDAEKDHQARRGAGVRVSPIPAATPAFTSNPQKRQSPQSSDFPEVCEALAGARICPDELQLKHQLMGLKHA